MTAPDPLLPESRPWTTDEAARVAETMHGRGCALPGEERGRRVRVEWKPADLWVGAFWKRTRWFGGFPDALTAGTDNHYDPRYAHRTLDVWVCLLPMVPLHFSSLSCPRPDECRARNCWIGRGGDRD